MQGIERKTLSECGARMDGEKVAAGGEHVEFSAAGAEKLGRDGFSVSRS